MNGQSPHGTSQKLGKWPQGPGFIERNQHKSYLRIATVYHFVSPPPPFFSINCAKKQV